MQYFCNMYAERIKNQGKVIDESTRFMLEVYIPLFSVSALLGVTGWVTSDAIKVIMKGDGGDDTSIAIMYGFACGNMLVDAVSTWMFYVRGSDILKNRTFSFSVDVADPQPKKEAAAMMEAAGGHVIMGFDEPGAGGSAIHEMGGARMGHDPASSVLNRWSQAHDVSNLFVTDGAQMSSSACQNPSLTYMALTARACDHAVSLMKEGAL